MARIVGNKLAIDGSDLYSNTGAGEGLELELVVNASGAITGVTILKGGTNYVVSTVITILHPTGTGAVLSVGGVINTTVPGEVNSISVDTPGTGYHLQGILKQASSVACTLVELDWLDKDTLASTPVRLTDAGTNIRWYSGDRTTYDTYQAVGILGNIENIEEGVELQSYSIDLTLSGIPAELRDEAFTDVNFISSFQNRPCKIYAAFLNSQHDVVDTPILLFSGQMDGAGVVIGDTVSITIGVKSRLIDWEIPRGGRFNSNDQKKWYPNDTGFDLIPGLLNREIYIGETPDTKNNKGLLTKNADAIKGQSNTGAPIVEEPATSVPLGIERINTGIPSAPNTYNQP